MRDLGWGPGRMQLLGGVAGVLTQTDLAGVSDQQRQLRLRLGLSYEISERLRLQAEATTDRFGDGAERNRLAVSFGYRF
jgi:hypothetical protein